jgi:DNA-binding SARP family transcriptional activator
VISKDRLIRAIWDEKPPATVREQVQICISALRQQIMAAEGRQLIETRRPGYLITVDEGALDAQVFETHFADGRSALAAGDPRRAAVEYRSALALWRGQALSGVSSRLVQQGVAHLNERRLTVLEECLSCELRAGMHHDLIGELYSLVEEHPLRERLKALLMAALYAAGRQAEALEVYHLARRMMIQELGIEPGNELQRLQHAILDGSLAQELASISSRLAWLWPSPSQQPSSRIRCSAGLAGTAASMTLGKRADSWPRCRR